jgi:hypothetical protein
MGPRRPRFPPATKALPQSEIAEYEQNDNHGSYKPDDVVHDTLHKFDTPSSAARRVGRDQMAKSLSASDVLSLEGRATLRRSPTVANACRARTVRKSLVRTVGSRTFSRLTGYVCTVTVNDCDPKRQIAVTGLFGVAHENDDRHSAPRRMSSWLTTRWGMCSQLGLVEYQRLLTVVRN